MPKFSQMSKPIYLIIILIILQLISFSIQQKTYTVTSLQVTANIPSTGCGVAMTEDYQLSFNGGTFTSVGIPILAQALYTKGSKPPTQVQATSPQATGLSAL